MTAIKARQPALGKRDDGRPRGRLEPAARRLLCTLAEGAVGVLRRGDVAVSLERRTGEVSLGAGRVALHLAEALVRDDLAQWSPMRGRRVLRITAAGQAHLARRAAPDESFAAQHREVAREDKAEATALSVNLAESPLSWLYRRREQGFSLSPAAFEAGERLRRDLTVARTMPQVSARWDAAGMSGAGHGPHDPAAASDRVLAARQRVHRALDAAGPDVAGLLIDVCGFLKGLGQVEAERHWPARSGKVVLALALERLAVHYGLSSEARGRDSPAAIRTWIAADGAP